MKVGVAVIGAGRWGRNHVQTLRELEAIVGLLAVYDIKLKKAADVASEFGAMPFDDIDAMLKRDDIGAAMICTSWSNLGKEARRALEANKHVLVEKPMASTIEEAMKILEIARQSGLVLTVGFLSRFIPAVQYLKKTEISTFGEFTSLISKRCSGGSAGTTDTEMGVIRDLAIP